MENNEKDIPETPNENNQPPENISGDEILNKIEQDAAEQANEEEHPEGNEFLKKFGFTKKDKLSKGLLAMKKENAELKQKADEWHDKYLRLYAEFDNFKKRSLKERIEFSRMAGADVISSMLPVLDDFKRAQQQMETSQDLIALKEGVKLIHQKLISTLEAKGLKPMKSIGEVFNPEFHDAITEISVDDESMKGKVVDEVESGYFLNDKIIRHAKVIVGK